MPTTRRAGPRATGPRSSAKCSRPPCRSTSPLPDGRTAWSSTDFDLWRQGDPVARTAYAVVGLTLGGLIVAAPFIPIFEDAFAFALAAVGLAYPEIKRLFFSLRQSRLLNRLIVAGERYQKDGRIHYVADSALFAELDAARTRAAQRVAEAERGVAGESARAAAGERAGDDHSARWRGGRALGGASARATAAGTGEPLG